MTVSVKIGDGYLEIEGRPNKSQLRIAAEESGKLAGESAGRGLRKSLGDSLGKSGGPLSGILRDALTPNPGMFDALRAPFAAALSTPIGAAAVAVAAVFGASFVAALAASLATAGIGAVFLGIGVVALKENEKIAKGFETLGNRIKKAFTGAAEPLIGPLLKAMNSLGAAAERVAPLMKQIFAGLAPAIAPLTAGITGFVEEFLKALTADPSTMKGISDALSALGANLPRVGQALGELFANLASNENTVKNIGVFFSILVNTLKVLGFVLDQASNVLAALVTSWHLLQDAAGAAWDWITGTAVPGIVGAFQSLMSWGQSLWTSVVGVWNGVRSAVSSGVNAVVGFIGSLPGRAASALASLWQSISSAFATAVSTARSKATELVTGAVSVVRGLPGKVGTELGKVKSAVTGAFSGAANWLVSAGRQILDGLISGIRAKIDELKNLLNSVTGLIPDWKGPLDVDRKLLFPAGEAIMQGLMVGIERQEEGLRKLLRGVTLSIPRAFGSDGASYLRPAPQPPASGGVGRTGPLVGSVSVVVNVPGGTDAQRIGDLVADQLLNRLAQEAAVL